MPVTAKLSKKLYDTLGEDLADELVDWFNQVDTSYQANLREFNDLNFQRFDAKLEQRLAQFQATFDRRFAEHDVKLEQRFVQHDAKWENRISKLELDISGLRASVVAQIAGLRAELIKWMFLFWLGTVATVLGFVSMLG